MRMLLLAALVCAPMVVSASKWRECICNVSYCHCNWLFGLDFLHYDCSRHLQKPRRNVCVKKKTSGTSRVLRSEEGCTCSHQQCDCQFGTDVEDSEICFESSDDVQCVRARRASKQERSKWVECVCNGVVCYCDWFLALDPSGVCLVQGSPTVACYATQQANGLEVPDREHGCFCSLNRCVCNFGTVVKHGEICFHLMENDTLCVPIKTPSKEDYEVERGYRSIHEPTQQRRRVAFQIPHRKHYILKRATQ